MTGDRRLLIAGAILGALGVAAEVRAELQQLRLVVEHIEQVLDALGFHGARPDDLG